MSERAPGASASLTRLERRLERERAARREAERISERVTRDLYDRRAELELLEMVATAANQAATIEAAMRVALEAVCAHTGWPVGQVYVLDRAAERLVSIGLSHVDPPERFAPFIEASEATSFASGLGLPGRVLANAAPAWIADLSVDPNFPRAEVARDVGLSAAFAFPVISGAEVLAVLEFFSPAETEPNEALLAVMAQVGTQLGRVVERVWGEQERARLSQRTEVLLSSAGEGIYGLDLDGRTMFVNPAAARMLGRTVAQMIGLSIHEVLHRDGDGRAAHAPEHCPFLTRGLDGGVSRSGEDVFWRLDGTWFPAEYIRTAMRDDEEVTGSVLTFSDVTERKRFESQLQYLADHDVLTRLFNRRRFEEELMRQVARTRRFGGGAALILDLDNFKYVNDTLGHHAGDEVIRSVAGLLTARLRATDIVARLGGDEFAVLLPDADRAQAEAVAISLADAIRSHTIVAAEQPVRITTSIGVTVLAQQEPTADEVLVEADIAMYEAKEAGRDRHAVYTTEGGRRTRREAGMPWTERIRQALSDDGFILYCQPILDLATKHVSQYELLLRLRGDEEDEIVLPGAFLPPAERFGLIRDIDRWVVHEAIATLSRIERSGADLGLLLEINLSGKSVGDPELPKLIERDLAETGADPSKLIFEITETAVIANMSEASEFARRLANLGCRFALDDFGAGFGSFYYLKYLPLDYLKIDGDFIEHLARSQIDQRMVKAMVEVARGLEMKTIAEYVSDQESVALLSELGVDYAQGFHVGMPAPLSAFGL